MKMILVDDHSLFRSGLVHLFNSQPDFTVVGEASTIKETIAAIKSEHPDLILMDLGLTDGSGIDAVSKILQIDPDVNIVFLTIHGSDKLAFNAIQAGAKGFLQKDISASALLTALRGLEKGELAVPRTVLSRFVNDLKHLYPHRSSEETQNTEATLTRREIDILIALGESYNNKEIAEKYSISVNTVKVHVHNVLRKLKVHNRREAAAYAQRIGLVDRNLQL